LSAGGTRRAIGPDDDQKTLMPVAADLNHAIEQFDIGDRAGAVQSVRGIITSHPRFSTAYTELARMQRVGGALPAAIDTMETAARLGVANHRMMTVLAGYLAESQQLEKAASLLQAVVADHPDDVEALNSLGVVASRRGDHAFARTTLKRAVELDPSSARAYSNLAADALAAGDLHAAVPDLQRAIALDPHAFDALFNLGMALWELARRAEAVPVLERFAREAPPQRYADDIGRVRALLKR
jgi:Tfp pilus assembly protein PilF